MRAICVCTICSISTPVQAEQDNVAEALFREGKQLMSAGEVDAACRKFEESERLDPATGTLLNLAVCHEQQGRLATAWVEFQEAVARSRRDRRPDRERFAEERLEAIEPQLSKAMIQVPEEQETAGYEVRLDGALLGAAAIGVAFPIDPGAHRVHVTAPGRIPWEDTFQVGPEPGTQRLVIPPLEQQQLTTEEDDHSVAMSSRRITGWSLAGVGALGLGIGAGFGVTSLIKSQQADCQSSGDGIACDSPDDEQLRRDARAWGHRATVALAAGAAALAVGVSLVIWDVRSQKQKAVAVALQSDGQLILRGSF